MSATGLSAGAVRPTVAVALALAALATLVSLAPVASAHGVAKPDPDQRLLQDWTDDCGGDGGAIQGSCKGSNDLIALDLIEKAGGNGAGSDQAVFRLYMDKGQSGSHDVTITLASPGKSYTLHSTDDAHWSGSGFASIGNAVNLGDSGAPGRFYVDAALAESDLGGAGSKLSGFKVEAKQNGNVGDFMPGGCHNAIGDCTHTDASDSDGGNYQRPDYTLQGPSYYLALGAPQSQQVESGVESIVQLDLTNSFQHTGQKIHLTVAGADGVQARFHNPSSPNGEGYSDSFDVDLPARGTSIAHLALTGQQDGAHGTLTVTATTDLGGRNTASIAYTVSGGAPPTSDGGSPPPSTPSKHSPFPAGPAVAAALVALAALRRRT